MDMTAPSFWIGSSSILQVTRTGLNLRRVRILVRLDNLLWSYLPLSDETVSGVDL